MRELRRVVVTGASSGLGAALARHYSVRGATVALIARREALLRELAASLPHPVAVYPVDVRDAAALAAAARAFIDSHGCPDLVIANAGISLGTLGARDEDLSAFREVVEINLFGMIATFQPFIGPMTEAGGGALAGIASVAGYRGLPGAAAYCASKAAMIAALESLRVELRGSGIAVTTICPGYIATPMTERNPYAMPFMLSADDATARIARAIAGRKSLAVIPWQMAVVARLLHVLPDRLYDLLFARAPRKPRRGE